MKTKSLTVLTNGSDISSGNSGKQAVISKVVPPDLGKQITERASLRGGGSLQNLAKLRRQRDMLSDFSTHSGHERVAIVATNPEESSQNSATKQNDVAVWPQFGHKYAMPKPQAPQRADSKKYEEKRHRFYMEPDQAELFDRACKLNGKSRSEVIVRQARSYIRQNLVKLRKAGVKVPPELVN